MSVTIINCNLYVGIFSYVLKYVNIYNFLSCSYDHFFYLSVKLKNVLLGIFLNQILVYDILLIRKT